MKAARCVAHFVTHRRCLVFGITVGVLALAAVALAKFLQLDSDVLNLLPHDLASVRALQRYHAAFAQPRELTFVLHDATGATDLEEFAAFFAESLRAQPWVARVLDRPPLADDTGRRDLHHLLVPLVLNLPRPAFDAALAALEPEAIRARMRRLRAGLDAGSPQAAMQLELDPLGVLAPVLQTGPGLLAIEQAPPLQSPDGTLRLVLVLLRDTVADPKPCQRLMRDVERFIEQTRAAWPGPGPAPQVLVTGRVPYVAEMSAGLEHDITWTLLGSFILASAVFYAGYRRVRPLAATLATLLVCSVVAVAVGALLFRPLNGIAMGLCAILIGLGIDFGIMLSGGYHAARREGVHHEEAVARAVQRLAHGIVFGALTTAAGFLVLLMGGCAGFAQLGVLIAIGILLAAALMLTLFFALAGANPDAPARSDLFSPALSWLLDRLLQRPRTVLAATLAGFGLLFTAALTPVGRLDFQANPRALEPRTSAAGHALRLMTEKMARTTGDPVLLLVDAPDADAFDRAWRLLRDRCARLVREGRLAAANLPGAFLASPTQQAANLAALRTRDLSATPAALRGALADAGFAPAAFAPAFAFVESMQRAAHGDLSVSDWRVTLPAESPWWFLLDRFFSDNPLVAAGLVVPPAKIDSPAAAQALREAVEIPGVHARLTGWSFLVQELVPWSQRKLALLSGAMFALNAVLLVFLYRRAGPLLLLLGTLVLAVAATLATVKLLAVPLNVFNVLAFPLVLGVGVDYGIYVLLAVREQGERQTLLLGILKPVVLSALTSIAGFGSLAAAYNPSLSGLGIVCAIGIAWSLVSTFFFVLPMHLWRGWR